MWNDIFDNTWKSVRLSEIDKMRSIFAADEAIEQMNRVILWATFAYQPDPLHTEAPFSRPALCNEKEENCGLWEPEEQPTTTVIDRHTRFEVGATAPGQSMSATRKKTPGTPKSRNFDSKRMDSSSSLSQKDFDGNSTTGSVSTGVFGNEPLIDIHDIADPLGNRRDKVSSLSDIEREYFEEMEREKQAKIRKEKYDAERAAEAARIKAAWDESMKEVEGKQWTVDAEGKVIVITPMIGDKMPSRNVPVKYGVRITNDSGLNDKDGKLSKRKSMDPNNRSGSSIKSTSKPSSAKSDRTENSKSKVHFTESFDNQPPLIKTLQPEGGVGLLYGNQKKNGRQYTIAGDPKRMSRSDYLEKTGFTGTGSDRSLEDLDMNPLNQTSGGLGMDSSISSSKPNTSKSKNASRQGSRGTQGDKFPLIDPLKGGRPRTHDPVPGSPIKANVLGSPDQRNKVLKGSESGMTSGSSQSQGNDELQDVVNTDDLFKSFEEIEMAAKVAELELLANMNNDLSFRTDKFDPAPVQRQRDKVLYKPQRDVRNSGLEGPLPTVNRHKLAPPTVVGMSTGHGSVHGDASYNGLSSAQSPVNHSNDSDDDEYDNSQAFSVVGGGSAISHGKSPESVIIPEESENQGLRYQIGIKDSKSNKFSKTRPVKA